VRLTRDNAAVAVANQIIKKMCDQLTLHILHILIGEKGRSCLPLATHTLPQQPQE
jgi:hypothetical protein